MPMKNPSHPGEIVRHDCLEPLGLSVTEGARVLGVSRQALNNVVNGKAGVSAEMAVRLSKAFGSKPEFWLRLRGGVSSGSDSVPEVRRGRGRGLEDGFADDYHGQSCAAAGTSD